MAEKRKNTVSVVWDLAQPIADSIGLILWDVKFLKEGANWYLRIIIDKEGGIGIDDCVAMNDAIDGPLDELDPIDQSYNLQISSPGIERELVRDFHFARYTGAKVILKLRQAFEGVKLHKCVLEGFEDGVVSVRFADGSVHSFEKQQYSSIKLDDFDSEE